MWTVAGPLAFALLVCAAVLVVAAVLDRAERARRLRERASVADRPRPLDELLAAGVPDVDDAHFAAWERELSAA